MSKKEQKAYGAIETDNYILFNGFFKKIYSNNHQKLNVLVDGEKIDTIIANENISVINDKYEIYDTKYFCFSYELPTKYIGEKHQLEFISEDGKQLLNSPLITLDKNDPKFNEYYFFYNLNRPLKKEVIKNTYTKNAIGFLAIEENLENKCFIKFIKRLYKKFPQICIKAFYFNEKQKNAIQNIFINESNRIQLIIPQNTYNDIANEIEVFIGLTGKILSNIVKGLLKYNQNIILVLYAIDEELAHTKLTEFMTVDNDELEDLRSLGILDNDIKRCNNKFLITAWDDFFKKNTVNYNFNHELTIEEYFIDILQLSFKYPVCKKYLIKLNSLYYKIGEI